MTPREAHLMFLGKARNPTPVQEEFYANSSACGFSETSRDKDKTDAVLFRALAATLDLKDPKVFHRVLVIIPPGQDGWLVERIHCIAVSAMKRVEPVDNPKKKAAMTFLRNMLGSLHLGRPALWPTVAPERWGAFGYTKDDTTVPDWLKEGLL